MKGFTETPGHGTYDVVIVGGAIMGSSLAWWLTRDSSFDGRVLVVERDPSYLASSTAHTNSCIRQQYSFDLNVRISQFAAAFIKDLNAQMGGDPRVPDIDIQSYGYMYLAGTEQAAATLRAAHAVQRKAGAATRLMTPDEVAAAYPFYDLDGILLGSHNPVDEGYWDGGTVFEWFRRKAIEQGAEYLAGDVVAMTTSPGRVDRIVLKTGEVISCGHIVNASGPRAARTAAMAGIKLPVEPRKRFSWVFKSEEKLPMQLPLTIDPSGIHIRQDGPDTYLAGCKPHDDRAVDPADFAMNPEIWEDHVWPHLANRIPAFDRLRLVAEWAGHYAYNTIDQNAILGPHPEVGNFLFMNGFSGHGLQQSPAMGRALAEWIGSGAYRSLDMTAFRFDRFAKGELVLERAII